jgi:hypothetical protein
MTSVVVDEEYEDEFEDDEDDIIIENEKNKDKDIITLPVFKIKLEFDQSKLKCLKKN